MFVQLSFLKEHEVGGEKWAAFFNRVWVHYEKWFLSEGYMNRPGYMTSRTSLEECMPELVPIYDSLCESVDGGDIKSRFLSMYCPPAYMSGCSQIAWVNNGARSLIRNYDYHPRFFDGTVFYSNYLKPIIGMTDCTWGLLDGINADGLCISLTFGGRKIVGTGFGVPIIVRYLLETCGTVDEACAALTHIPSHMAYNLTLLDADGDFRTVYLAPDRAPQFVYENHATNHQGYVEWKEYAHFSKTVERKQYLEFCNAHTLDTSENIMHLFLRDPLYHTQYEKSFGTLYTSVYDAKNKALTLAWPKKQITVDFHHFEEHKMQVTLKNILPKHI